MVWPSRGESEDALRVLAEELRPYVLAEPDSGELGEDRLERQTHREVARVDDLVGAARVRVVDDVAGVVLRCERARRVVEVGPLQEELDRQRGPRLAALAGHP